MASRLASAVSPYLRAHADNPVDWHPWGEQAFAEAERRDVPVLVSIGYSTCHWCHVMARESFSDEAAAAQLNAQFVAIKVDREEHPDVDAAFMAAAGAFTRDLGWPLTVFTTPAGRAFYAGTYFPPTPRPPLPSFRQVLDAVHEAWTGRRDAVEESAGELTAALARISAAPAGATDAHDAGAPPSTADLAQAAVLVLAREDAQHGGFGEAGPKFPMVPALRLLQAPLLTDRSPEAAATAARTMARMAESPLRDPIEGGFFRYATRRDWSVPHYERMLTDNAGLLEVALDADQQDTARGIARFLTGVLAVPGGGFGAAQDSESWIDGARSEGGYYARTADERRALAAPAVDAKLVTAWNGMAIAALARAGTRWGDDTVIAAAREAASAVLRDNVAADGTLRRASLGGTVSDSPAGLEDYGRLADGLLALSAATGEVDAAVRARELVDAALSGVVTGDPVLRRRGIAVPESGDGDHGSGRAALAAACLSLWRLGAGERYRRVALERIAPLVPRALREPLGFGILLRAAADLAVSPRQLVVLTDDPADALVRAARGIPADVTAIATAAQASALADAGFELFAGRGLVGGRSAVYDCRGFTCRLPVTETDDLADGASHPGG